MKKKMFTKAGVSVEYWRAYGDKCTGLRKPKTHLKTWEGSTIRLTPRLQVGHVDEDLPGMSEVEDGRKSWYLSLTGEPDLFKTLGPVHGAPTTGKTLLLFEDDVVALVEYLLDGLVEYDEASGRMVNVHAKDWQDTARRRLAIRERRSRAAKGGKKS